MKKSPRRRPTNPRPTMATSPSRTRGVEEPLAEEATCPKPRTKPRAKSLRKGDDEIPDYEATEADSGRHEPERSTWEGSSKRRGAPVPGNRPAESRRPRQSLLPSSRLLSPPGRRGASFAGPGRRAPVPLRLFPSRPRARGGRRKRRPEQSAEARTYPAPRNEGFRLETAEEMEDMPAWNAKQLAGRQAAVKNLMFFSRAESGRSRRR